MDLRRLEHQLASLWQSDDGFHAQMNSVIGALQELKLLQVQTVLEELEFSSKTNQGSSYTTDCTSFPETLMLDRNNHSSRETNLNQTQNPKRKSLSQECCRSELGMEPSLFLTSSPVGNLIIPRRQEPMPIKHRGSLSTSSSFSSSQEDTIDSSFSPYDIDDPTDWTASLMNHSRNRQPLVLGDNIFADLVGNWLDLPDVRPPGSQTASDEENDSSLHDTFNQSSPVNHSQELSRKLSLTANIFKRVLRRVRPGRDKFLKECPGEIQPGREEMELFKQPKITCRKPKGDVSKPFWARARGLRRKTTPTQLEGVAYQSSEGLIGRGWAEIGERHPPVLDYSSVVWV